MNSKKIMSVFGVAMLFAQMGFADVSQEITADEAQGIEQQIPLRMRESEIGLAEVQNHAIGIKKFRAFAIGTKFFKQLRSKLS